MGYNYSNAFAETKVELPTATFLKQLAVAACMKYLAEFGGSMQLKFEIYTETKHIEVSGGPEPRIYSWKQLGFND